MPEDELDELEELEELDELDELELLLDDVLAGSPELVEPPHAANNPDANSVVQSLKNDSIFAFISTCLSHLCQFSSDFHSCCMDDQLKIPEIAPEYIELSLPTTKLLTPNGLPSAIQKSLVERILFDVADDGRPPPCVHI